MPEQPDPPADEQDAETPPVEEDRYLFDDVPEEEVAPNADLAAAFAPTEEDYAAFDPRLAASQPASTQDDQEEDKEVRFDPRYVEEFEGLLFVGSLRKRFRWMGHEFVIRTLTTNETLEVALIQKPYLGTLGEIKAYQAAVVAACIVTVDGNPPPIPVTDDGNDLEARFFYVVNHWQPIIIDMIYGQLMMLEQKVNEVLVAMGKAPS